MMSRCLTTVCCRSSLPDMSASIELCRVSRRWSKFEISAAICFAACWDRRLSLDADESSPVHKRENCVNLTSSSPSTFLASFLSCSHMPVALPCDTSASVSGIVKQTVVVQSRRPIGSVAAVLHNHRGVCCRSVPAALGRDVIGLQFGLRPRKSAKPTECSVDPRNRSSVSVRHRRVNVAWTNTTE
jgi:hypothetical protein